MPDAQGRLFARDIAERIGLQASDWRARVSRQVAPAAVGQVEIKGVLHRVWDPAVVDLYVESRRIRLTASAVDTVPRSLPCPHDACTETVRSWAALNQHIRDAHSGGRK